MACDTQEVRQAEILLLSGLNLSESMNIWVRYSRYSGTWLTCISDVIY